MAGVFISYRRDDSSAHAGRLFDRICEQLDEELVFMDVDSIKLGTNFYDAIDNALSRCQILLVVIGPRWLNSTDARGLRRIDDPRDFVRLEIETALRRGIPVVPILMDGAYLPSPAELPPGLADLAFRQAVEISHAQFRSDSSRLITEVVRAVGASPSRPSRIAAANPVSWSATHIGTSSSTAWVFDIQLTKETHSLEVLSGMINWRIALDGRVVFKRPDWRTEMTTRFPISDGDETRSVTLFVKVGRLNGDLRQVRIAVDGHVLFGG